MIERVNLFFHFRRKADAVEAIAGLTAVDGATIFARGETIAEGVAATGAGAGTDVTTCWFV